MILNVLNMSIWSSTFYLYVNLVIVVKWWMENADETNSLIKIILICDVMPTQGKKKVPVKIVRLILFKSLTHNHHNCYPPTPTLLLHLAWTVFFAYGFMLAFVAFTIFLLVFILSPIGWKTQSCTRVVSAFWEFSEI